MRKEYNKVLVLYVDSDGDVVNITGEKTPIIGREKNLEIAKKFAILAPEEADVNAMFFTIKIYDEIINEKIFPSCEIATISGEEKGGLISDIKIKKELTQVLEKFKADGVIFISDGGKDELLIPTISSIIPIISIKRVVVRQAKGFEEFYLLMIKYFKRIISDPYLKKWFVGFPGLLILIYAFLASANLAHIFSLAFLIVLGTIAFIKGFSIDEVFLNTWNKSKIQIIASIMGIFLGLIGIYNGINIASEIASKTQDITTLEILGEFLIANFASFGSFFTLNTLHILAIASIIYLAGRGIEKYMENKSIKHEVIVGFFLFSLSIIGTFIGIIISRPISPSVWGPAFLPAVFILFSLNVILIIIITLYEKYSKKVNIQESKD